MSVDEKVNKETGPYKLLALDGGGIRGLITIEVLAKIEEILRQTLGRGESFVLADYFDYIAGTSTGAIIATGLSLGMPVGKIRDFYLKNGKKMFDRASILKRHLFYLYEDEELAEVLQEVFGKESNGEFRSLGTKDLKTLLMLVMRNVTTDSPWPVSNNPLAKYNDCSRTDCNLNLPLWKLVRASTAAPTFFPPEKVTIGKQNFIFVDGGITPYNNPAFQLFLMATVEPYNLNWSAGENNMLLVSVGTGTTPNIYEDIQPSDMHKLFQASSLPLALMFATQNEQDLLCRVFGKCLVGDPLDREVGDLVEKKGPVNPKFFTYLRYNAELTHEGLDKLGLGSIKLEHVQQMDSVDHISELQQVGKVIAEQKVSKEHFTGFLA
jgi:hypothetical protein